MFARAEPKRTILLRIKKHWHFYVMFIPVIAYYVIFCYWPSFYGFIISFKDLKIGQSIFDAKWVGLNNFKLIFSDKELLNVIKNTIELSLLRILINFFPPILLAVAFYDFSARKLRTFCQTLSYIPHFLSWIVIYGIAFALFSVGTGLVNHALELLGFARYDFMTSREAIRFVIIFMELWKGLGWSTIIYFATMSSIDPQLFEAAKIDGAGPLQRVRAITLPSLLPIISLTLCLSLGRILYAGGQQVLLFYNPATYGVVDIIDTWVYRVGIGGMRLSIGTAMGLFQSVIGMILVLISNYTSRKLTGIGIW